MFSPSANRIAEIVVVVIICVILVALLLPNVQMASSDARQERSRNNLKQIGLALHVYADANSAFPARAIRADDGSRLLSWRVAILPYLASDMAGRGLYEQFHLDEPWDSEHNLKLLDSMPVVFANPNSETSNKTNYLAIDCPNALLSSERGTTKSEWTDGLSNTVMAVEADRSVPWTKPEDLNFDPTYSKKDLGHFRRGGFVVLLGDGSVRMLINSINDEILRGLMTVSGGEDVAMP